MKKNALALLLAICMVISLLPTTVFAAQELRMVPRTAPVELEQAAGEIDGLQPQASYTVNLSGGSNGATGLMVNNPVPSGELVFFVADPDDGYLANVYVGGIDPNQVQYVGYDMWGFYMPPNNVTIQVQYVRAPGVAHDIAVIDGEGGEYTTSRTAAYAGESVYLEVKPDDPSQFQELEYLQATGGDLLYVTEADGVYLYELFMPEEIVTVFVEYKPSGPHDINVEYHGGLGTVTLSAEQAWYRDIVTAEVEPAAGYYVLSLVASSHEGARLTTLEQVGDTYSFAMHPEDVTLMVFFEGHTYPVSVTAGEGGSAYVNMPQARTGEEVLLTCLPQSGYEVASVTGVDILRNNGDNTYTFAMPPRAVDLQVTFRPKTSPVRVVMETTVGGSAAVDLAEARPGDTVTLTCQPQEGYRVAKISGVEGLIDNGDGTYTFIMPTGAVELHVWILREDNPFLDVHEPRFYHEAVLWAAKTGVTSGITATTFEPNSTCTRSQVVTFLWRAVGQPEPTITEHPFTDVQEGKFYYKAMLWALEKGITSGTGADTFAPDDPCTRGQVVTFLWRAMGQPEPTRTEHPFTDVQEGKFYYQAMLWAVENGVTSGVSDTAFDPDGTCTRGQVVTFLYRADQLPEPEPGPTDPTDPTDPTEPEHTHIWKLNKSTGDSMNEGDVTINAGDSFNLKILCRAVGCDASPEVTWTAEPAGVVGIEGSRITGLQGGKSTWLSTEWEGVTYRCLIRVRGTQATDPTEPEPTETEPTEPEPTETDPTDPTEPEHTHIWKLNKSIGNSLSEGEVSIDVGETFTLKILCRGAGCKESPEVTWTADTDGVVGIEGNRITGLQGGKKTWVSAEWEGITYRCLIRVRLDPNQPTEPEPTDPEPTEPEPTDPEPTDPEPTEPEHTHQWKVDTYYGTDTQGDVTIYVSERFTLKLVCKVEDCEEIPDVVWTADTEGVVAIDGSRITGITGGRMTTLRTELEGVTYECIVRVRSKTNRSPVIALPY